MGAYDNSIPKELHLRFMEQIGTDSNFIPIYSLYEQIGNDRIVSESMSLTMGILEGTQFKLGSYVIPEMTVTIFYNGNRYKNKLVRVWINDVGSNDIHGLLCGEVYQEKLSDDRQTITLTIRHLFYNAFFSHIDWNEAFFPNTEPQNENFSVRTTIKSIYRSLIKYTYSYSFKVFDPNYFDYVVSDDYIENAHDNSGKFVNIRDKFADFDIMNLVSEDVITYTAKLPENEKKSVAIGQIWQWFGEFCGVHWVIDKPRYTSMADIEATQIQIDKDIDINPIRFDEISVLLPNDELYPQAYIVPYSEVYAQHTIHEIPYYISVIYDDLTGKKYQFVSYDSTTCPLDYNFNEVTPPFVFSDNNILFDYSYLYSGRGQIFPQPMAWATHIRNIRGKDSPNYALKNYFDNLDKIIYAVLDSQADLDIRLGDNISFVTADNSVFVIPVMTYTISGINDLRVTYRTPAIQEI